MIGADAAFAWIIRILQENHIPFQITGGLAAIAYGCTRPLEDIDIDIPEAGFPILRKAVDDYIVYGPAQYKDASWEIMLMTLDYHGHLIDFSGTDNVKIFNREKSEWEQLYTDFSNAEVKKIFELNVPVISKNELIYYKSALARPVDLIDVQQFKIKDVKNS